MQLRLFLSRWTGGAFSPNLSLLLRELQRLDVSGLELSLADLGSSSETRHASAAKVEEAGLRLILGVYSSWADYEAPHPGLGAPGDSVATHLRTLETELDAAATLCQRHPGLVAHVNVHGGSDHWAPDEAEEFLGGALRLGAAFLDGPGDGVGASVSERDPQGRKPRHLHGFSLETHRGRCCFHPGPTARLLERFPPLRLTLDLSHWHLVCERLPDRQWLLDEIVPHVDHIHARIGSAQAPQTPPGEDASFAASKAYAGLWKAVWQRKWERGAEEALVTPELGPPPYQTRGGPEELWMQTIDKLGKLRRLFAEWEGERDAAGRQERLRP